MVNDAILEEMYFGEVSAFGFLGTLSFQDSSFPLKIKEQTHVKCFVGINFESHEAKPSQNFFSGCLSFLAIARIFLSLVFLKV